MNPNDIMMSDQPETSKPQPMAFTINFSDGKDNVSTKMFRDNLAKYTRHVRNASLPNVEESKKSTRNGASTVQAVCMSPLTARKGIMSRRPGYHSEGYFSSDQEDDLRAKSDIFVRKLKNIDKGIRMTNLAQEKKIMADQCSQRKVKLGIQNEPHEFGDFGADINGESSLMDDDDDDDDYNAPPHPPAGSPLTLPDTRKTEDWLGPDASDDDLDNPSDPIETPMLDEAGADVDDVLNDSSNDTVSEAGTYTIERDNPCPEVMRARQDLENVILKIGQMQTFGEDEIGNADESTFKRSLYSDGSHWINEWATQVAKHNHNGEYEKPSMPGLPPLPVGKQQGPTPVSTSKIASPVHERHMPPTARKFTPPQCTGPRNIRSPLTLVHDATISNDVVNIERHSDSSLETESFLRTTESVVSAMQARMSLSMDSGGESDVDTSHSYRGPEKSRAPALTTAGERYLATRRPSNASEGSGRLESRAAQSDSSSEAGENKGKKKETSVASAPQMRYNRAFSLRRARLDCEPEPPTVDKKKKPAVNEGVTSIVNKPKKLFESARATPQRTVKAKSPKPEAFSRTDSGRFSIRATKPPAQTPHTSKPTSAKKDSKRTAGGRSNSTLSSREVEFQNWKRRKSYDPMKAAAEGKKKEAAKKASMSTSMTQASIADPDTSPSHQNPVLRSASFHGTGGITPNYVSSEEEVTLSADEDSPISGCPPSLITSSSPSKAILEGAFGGSRTSLHSTASNSSLGRRAKLEALDNLVMAAVCGLSNKLRGHSCKLLKKLRYLYEEDSERAEKLNDVIDLLETTAPPDSPSKSPSKELSGTLKNLKRIETVFKVLDDVLFDEEDFEQEMDGYQ